MFNVDPAELTKKGFVEYFESPADTVGENGIKDKMRPTNNPRLIFIGCGSRDNQTLDVGITATPAELFDQTKCGSNTSTAKETRKYYTYYCSDHDGVMGFSRIKNVYFGNHDYYDCNQSASTYSCKENQMDSHRVSFTTGKKFVHFI